MASPDPTDPTARPASSSLYRYRFDSVEFDESANELKIGGQVVQVERIPLRLLSELLRSPNEVVTRAELFESVWEGRPTVDHVLANAVNKLRNALGEEVAQRLVNIPRVGYRFNGPIERTAVGRHTVSVWPMAAGQPVPGRDGYVLERSLGSAPQSPVWLAREARLGERRVFKFAVDGERLSALKREHTLYRVLRQELGERPDFARIVGANFSTAPYFLECEYAGPDLRAWAAEGDRLASLPMAERIALFLQIARAVMAAHGVGVLHKDLKPANVLVAPTPDGEGWGAKLTDFGSARLLEPGRLAELGVTAMGLTMTQGISPGDMSGTPLYLAPELLAGQSPTVQSDLYSLGLMLYQLTVGDLRRPLVTGWQRDIDDELLREDITAATEGKPTDRMGSVAELVERLQSLDARRVARIQLVRSAEQAHRTERLLQRSQARRPWIAAALISLAVGLTASLWFYSQVRESLRLAEEESARTRAINDFLNKDVLQTADVLRDRSSQPWSMRDVLHRASENASQRFRGQPQLEAAVRLQLGRTFLRMDARPDAEPEYQRAEELLAGKVGESDPQLLRVRLARVEMLARALDAEGNGLKSAIRMLADVERAAGPKLLSEKSELAFLAARAKFEVAFRREYRAVNLQLGQAVLPDALRMLGFAESVEGIELEDRLTALQNVAEMYIAADQRDRSEAVFQRIEAEPAAPPHLREIVNARAMRYRAVALAFHKRYREAEHEFSVLRERLLSTLGPTEVQLGFVDNDRARVFVWQEKFAEAEEAYASARRVFAAALGDWHRNVDIADLNRAHTILSQGRAAEALAVYEGLLPRFAMWRTSPHLELDVERAAALTLVGRPTEALGILESVPAEDLEGRSVRFVAEAERGRALVALGRYAEAAIALRAAIESGRRYPPDLEDLYEYRKLPSEAAAAEALAAAAPKSISKVGVMASRARSHP